MIHRRGVQRKVLFIAVAMVAAAVLGFVVMSLWNWLIPALFGGRLITFWQALGVLVLSKILFGGFFRRMRFVDRWEKLRPEEREKFRAAMRGRWGGRANEPETL